MKALGHIIIHITLPGHKEYWIPFFKHWNQLIGTFQNYPMMRE
jgi:hypothetical protein